MDEGTRGLYWGDPPRLHSFGTRLAPTFITCIVSLKLHFLTVVLALLFARLLGSSTPHTDPVKTLGRCAPTVGLHSSPI